MNAHFPQTLQKAFTKSLVLTALVALAVLMMVNFTLTTCYGAINSLSINSSVAYYSLENAGSHSAVWAVLPVPTAPVVRNQVIATPLPPQTSQPTPRFTPVPTPPAR